MRRGAMAVALAGMALMSCGVSRTTGPLPLKNSRLEVYVHWEGAPLADRQLEILELGLERFTDETGIAEFLLTAGTYTLRAYVNRGGPPSWLDVTVTTTPGRTTRIEIVDCTPCVTPAGSD